MSRNNRNYKFETLQLHAGQEQPDSATGARAVRWSFYLLPFSY